MNAPEVILTQIQGLSSSAEDIAALHCYLKQAEDFLHIELPALLSLLDQLDPAIHSLGYLYVLHACVSITLPREQAESLVLIIMNFITSCVAEQIRLEPKKFVCVCKMLKDQLVLSGAPIRGVTPMLTAVQKLQSSSECLTSLHAEFLQLCLLAKCYKAALLVLEDDIFEVDQPRDFFLYCYYGGMIFIGQKHFQKAMELLRSAVIPYLSYTSAVAVEAYKKFILVSLIHKGQFSAGYKLSPSVHCQISSYCRPAYFDLIDAYTFGQIKGVERCIQMHSDIFKNDNNYGLVQQVLSSMCKKNIQKLTQTYLTLSLQDIANLVHLGGPKEAEMHVLQMIQDGMICATINQKDGMVRFQEDSEQYKSFEMINKIDSSIHRIIQLSKRLTAMDEQLSYDPSYLAKAGKGRQKFDFDDLDSVPPKFNI